MTSRLILNGKSAGLPAVREAVQRVREEGTELEVRVTWEGGDAARLAREACHESVERVIAGGGDGSVHEVLNGMLKADAPECPAFGILPLGTANDFATSCGIPKDLAEALRLAVNGTPVPVDVGRANEHYFMNVASGGFGAAVTTATPLNVKRLLGGAAYTLMGMIMAVNFQPHEGRLVLPDAEHEMRALVGAVGNGRQAGGGQVLAPSAFIDDGLLDVLVVREFPMDKLGAVVDELENLAGDGEFVSYYQVPWLESHSSGKMPINLDGEPIAVESVRFEVVPKAIQLVVPATCPLLSRQGPAVG
ncbi:MAG: lipid kinase YegS [Pseudomonadota bacterium]|nr:MAG: lipid kinase YegS [Pseudomonadota bacterium]